MNNIKIYRGITISESRRIQGVDLDSFTITEKIDESFDYGMFNVVTSQGDLNLKSRDIITIIEFENEERITESNLSQYIVKDIARTIIKKSNNKTTYEYQVSFYEKSAEACNTLTPNIESTQPLPSLWKELPTPEFENYVELNGKPNKVIKFLKVYEVSAYNSQYQTIAQLEWRNGYELSLQGTISIPLPTFRRRINTRVYLTEWTEIPGDWVYNYYYRILKDGTLVASGNYSDNPNFVTTEKGVYQLNIYYYNDNIMLTHEDDWQETEIFISTQIIVNPNGDAVTRDIDNKFHTTYEVLQKLVWTIKPYDTTNGVPTHAKYSLGSDLDWLKNELCPDIYLTENNLFANLILIARTCNCIPYIDDNNVVHFINLGDKEKVPSIIEEAFNRDIRVSDYERCGAVVSELQNMIPTSKIGNATCEDSWRTLETEPGKQFTADNCFYRSDFPIYQIKDMRIRYWNASGNLVGEESIFKNMFESSVYGTLDSTNPTAYNSIINALKWTQYSDRIEGFAATTTEWTISGLHPTAICKILQRTFGVSVDSSLIQNWNNRIMLKAIYIPVIDARVKQFRPQAFEFGNNEMILSQQTNLGSLEEVGNSMKHSLNQTGNDVIQRNIFVKNWSDVPKVNQVLTIDDETYKVTQVVRSFSINGYDLIVYCTKDFNRISAYQSLATEKRWSDIPLDKAIVRTINLEDYCYIGDVSGLTEEQGSSLNLVPLLLLSQGGYLIWRTIGLVADAIDRDRPHYFAFRLKSADGTTYPNTETCQADGITDNSWVVLPVTSGAFGNSVFIKAKTLDNYSAGHCLVERNGYKYTMDIPYADDRGEGLLLDFRIICGDKKPESFDKNYCLTSSASTFAILGNNIYLNKGAREQLEFVYQMHYISTSKDIVIGRALTEFNPMITSSEILKTKQKVKLVVIDHFVDETNTDCNNLDGTEPFEIEYGTNLDLQNNQVVCKSLEDMETFADFNFSGDYSICLVSEFEQEFYDDRPPQTKRELIVAKNLGQEYNDTEIEGFVPFTFHYRGNFMN